MALNKQIDSKNLAKKSEINLETGHTPSSVTVFFEGPDSLEVGQTGDYYIAVINSSPEPTTVSGIRLQIPEFAEILMIEREAQIDELARSMTWTAQELASGQQERIRFRLKVIEAGEVDFPVTITQDENEPQTISKTTSIK